MQAAGPILGLAGSLVSAVGQSQADKYAAAQSERAAQVGRIQADQIDANYRDELNSTISNIRAIRASAGVGANSPTGMAIEAKQQKTSDRDRKIDVGSRRMQATQDEQDAAFRRSSAKYALIGGAIGGLSKFASSGGFSSSTYALGA
jgi:hypothetical protein